MLKVYFINPKSGLESFSYELPLNICQLISCIKNKDFIEKIGVLDLEFDENDINLIDSIENSDNTIFCIPIYTYYSEETINLCKAIKRTKDLVKIVVGGPHATLVGENLLRDNTEIDFVLQGEGDYSLPELLRAINFSDAYNQVNGLIYRDESNNVLKTGEFDRIEDISCLPLQTKGFEYFNLKKVKDKIGFLPYISSRGCSYNCIFCSSSNIWKRKLKLIPASTVIKEIEYIKSLGFNYINFRDDFFTANNKWLDSLLSGLKDLGIVWGCETRIDAVNDDLLFRMKESGCELLRFGIETFNQKSLDIIGKKFKADLAVENLKKVIDMGFYEIRCSFMVGIPGESVDDVKNTISICRQLKSMKSRFWALAPVIGTEIYNNMEKYGIKFINQVFNSTYSNIETTSMTNTEINNLLEFIYDEFKHPLTYYHRDFSDIIVN
ncbi:radical SAM superfamily enzyme YgiQ (UPF0313 family) [Anaerobacterium chartisolvens]|uniref:Radical SAM superfamily enzyme YgiQ (UPF0313 family) n=1 Tax=Anaerobacterium chartisolvens TaxID=1297424 RepID=A0A369BHX3_9FIRM|nr:radical SAM protein [Anaerobacterium chartisolvens]RCX21011.1 radical SAM superfamily enzyme YgiQ (UPF0313 family) [Anaerobacterium chartisolvens]